MIWQLWWWWWWGFEIICCYTPDNRTRLTKGHCSPSPCDLSFGFQTFANIFWGLSFGKFGIGKNHFGFGNLDLGKSLKFGIFGLGKEWRSMTTKRQRDNYIMNLNKIVCCEHDIDPWSSKSECDSDFYRSKCQLFEGLSFGFRKSGLAKKVSVL